MLTPGITLTPQEDNTSLSNSFKQTTPIFGSNFTNTTTPGLLTREESSETTQISAGGLSSILSIPTTYSTNKRPTSLSLSHQLPPHFSSFLPAPIPQIIQPSWKDNRKILTSLLARTRQTHRGLTLSPTPLTAHSKETLLLYLLETEIQAGSL